MEYSSSANYPGIYETDYAYKKYKDFLEDSTKEKSPLAREKQLELDSYFANNELLKILAENNDSPIKARHAIKQIDKLAYAVLPPTKDPTKRYFKTINDENLFEWRIKKVIEILKGTADKPIKTSNYSHFDI